MSFMRVRVVAMMPAKALACALALACGAPAASAQSLTEVIDAARSVDPAYLGAHADADAAQYRYEQAKAAHLPAVNLSVGGQRNVSNTPYTSPSTQQSNSANATLGAQQTLFNRQNDLLIEQGDKSVEIAHLHLQQFEQDLLIRVSQAYFNVLAAAEGLQTVRASRQAIAEQLASAKRNFEVGNATITDTREAEARFDLARSQEIAAENDLQVSQVSLDQLIGRTGVTPRPLALPTTLPAVMPAAVSDWVRLAEEDNPAARQARLSLEIAQLENGRARAGNLPTVVASASYNKNYAHQEMSAAAGSGKASGYGDGGNIAVTMNLPLFAGFSIQNRIKETVALEERARTDAQAAHDSATLNTRQAFLGTQSLSAQVKALEAAETSSKLAVDATTLGYKVGVKVNLDVLNAQSQLYQTQRDLAKARYDYLMATLKLRQAAGTLGSNDIAAVNTLLTH